ncbi:MAG: hypothetical protein M3O09_19035 [Acidobacteriota bacterium]|jgi:ABC-type phosphate transport system substrate-binding protein|nr:hypothetical protein [Acidobacteriota bacterium]
MKFLHVLRSFTFAILLSAPCFAHHMAVVVANANPNADITSKHLARIFKMELRKWPDGKDVIVVLHKNSNGEMITLERLGKMSLGEMNSVVATHKDAIRFVASDADMLKEVEATPGAVGLVDFRSVDGHVKVVKVDGKFPSEEGYLPH